jgi:hypothetical protein
MTQRVSESLVAVLIRIGLLLALVILLMAENAQAQPRFVKLRTVPAVPHSFPGTPTRMPRPR